MEKRHRRTLSEVMELVAKAKQMVASGVAVTKACEDLDLTYQTYQRHAGKSTSTKGTSGKVQKLLSQLVDAIRDEVRAEIKASL